MQEVQDKLDVWVRLFQLCEEMQLRLNAAQMPDSGIDPLPIEAELRTLKTITNDAFRGATAALHRRSGDPPMP